MVINATSVAAFIDFLSKRYTATKAEVPAFWLRREVGGGNWKHVYARTHLCYAWNIPQQNCLFCPCGRTYVDLLSLWLWSMGPVYGLWLMISHKSSRDLLSESSCNLVTVMFKVISLMETNNLSW